MYSQLQKRAHKAVEKAVLRGELARHTTCENCGNACEPHAHHDDYNKPIQVRWLCRSCHALIHPGNRLPIASRIAAELTAGAIY